MTEDARLCLPGSRDDVDKGEGPRLPARRRRRRAIGFVLVGVMGCCCWHYYHSAPSANRPTTTSSPEGHRTSLSSWGTFLNRQQESQRRSRSRSRTRRRKEDTDRIIPDGEVDARLRPQHHHHQHQQQQQQQQHSQSHQQQQQDVAERLKLTSGQLQRRQLADKYHPDKANFSCTLYFTNGTSTTITAPLPAPNNTLPVPQARDGYGYGGYGGSDEAGGPKEPYGYGGADGDGWNGNVNGNADDEEDLPPPCRLDNGNNVIVPPPPEGGEDEESFTVSAIPIDEDPPDDGGSGGGGGAASDGQMDSSGLRPMDGDAQDEAPPSEDDDTSVVGNIVRTQVSVALPPDPYGRGIPRKVARAVTRLFNITSNLREEDMRGFLEAYEGTKSESTVSELLDYVDELREDLPTIIPLDQTVLFFLRYQRDFQRQNPSHALFWEMVHKDTHADPIYRTESPGHKPIYYTTEMPSTPVTPKLEEDIEEHPELANVELSHWWLHTVAYRCYLRDQDGQVQPLFDTVILDLIQEQMDLWMEFHVNVTNQILEGLDQYQAIGVAMPGREYDVFIDNDAWTSVGPSGRPEANDYEDDALEYEGVDMSAPTQGTYNEPLLTSESSVLDTTRQVLGLVVLLGTVTGTFLWTSLAYIYRARRQEQAVWGAAVGTEQALQDLLSVGWRIHDQADGGDDSPRQVLEIYNRTKDGMGYRDDDSLLQGGVNSLR